MHRYHVNAGLLLFFCHYGRSKFITKIWRYRYFRYKIFPSSQYYFRCTIETQHEQVPNFSCPVLGGLHDDLDEFW